MSFFKDLFGSDPKMPSFVHNENSFVNKLHSIGRVYPAQQSNYTDITNTTYTTTSTGTSLPYVAMAQGGVIGGTKENVDPNTQPEMQLSLQDAHGLWLAKFGDQWVKQEVVEDTHGLNWTRVASRLTRAMLMEYAVDYGYYKLVPQTWK